MIRYVYSFFHCGAKYFTKPEVNEIVPQNAVISTKRDLIKNAPSYIQNGIQNCDFCCLGSFDDETGKFDGSPEVLLSQPEILKTLRSAIGEEVNENA